MAEGGGRKADRAGCPSAAGGTPRDTRESERRAPGKMPGAAGGTPTLPGNRNGGHRARCPARRAGRPPYPGIGTEGHRARCPARRAGRPPYPGIGTEGTGQDARRGRRDAHPTRESERRAPGKMPGAAGETPTLPGNRHGGHRARCPARRAGRPPYPGIGTEGTGARCPARRAGRPPYPGRNPRDRKTRTCRCIAGREGVGCGPIIHGCRPESPALEV